MYDDSFNILIDVSKSVTGEQNSNLRVFNAACKTGLIRYTWKENLVNHNMPVGHRKAWPRVIYGVFHQYLHTEK